MNPTLFSPKRPRVGARQLALAMAATLLLAAGPSCAPVRVEVTMVDEATRLEQEALGTYQAVGSQVALTPTPQALGLAAAKPDKAMLDAAVANITAALAELDKQKLPAGQSRALCQARLEYNRFAALAQLGRKADAANALAKAKAIARQCRLYNLLWKIQYEDALLLDPKARAQALQNAAKAVFSMPTFDTGEPAKKAEKKKDEGDDEEEETRTLPLFLLSNGPVDHQMRTALLAQVVAALAAQGEAEAALGWVETFDALDMCLFLDSAQGPLGPPEAKALDETVASLRKIVLLRRSQLLQIGPQATDQAQQLDGAIAQYQDAAADAESERFGRLYYFQPVEAMDAQAVLPDDGAYLRCYLAGRKLYVWLVTAEDLKLKTVEVDDAFLAKIDALAEQPLDWTAADVERMSKALIEPVAAGLANVKRLYVAPGPRLLWAPWPALKLGGAALCERVQLAFATNAADLSMASLVRSLFKRSVVLCPASDSDQTLGERMSKVFDRMTTLTRGDAAPGELLAAAHSHDAVHLGPAYHLHFARPWESYVALDGPGSLERVRLTDLASLDFTGQLFTLASLDGETFRSDCDERPLARTVEVLHAVGAPSVLVALPAKRGALDPKLWEDFYANFAKLQPGEALRRVQAAALGADPQAKGWTRLRLFGHLGMSQEEAEEFADEAYGRVLEALDAAAKAERWADVLRRANQAIKLLPFLPDRAADELVHERTAMNAAFRALLFEDAVEHGRKLVRLLVAKGDKKALATARYALGMACSRAGQTYFDEAVANLTQSIQLYEELGQPKDVLAKVTELAWVYRQIGQYAKSVETFERGLKLSQHAEASAYDLYRGIGTVYYFNLNRYANAEGSFRKALAAARRAKDQAQIAQSLIDLGIVRERLGDFAAATKRYDEAIKVAAAIPDESLQAKAHFQRANVHWFQADYADARKDMRTALAIFTKLGNAQLQVAALNTKGLIFWTLNDYAKALANFEQAMALAKAAAKRKDIEMRGEIASTHNNMGLIYRDRGQYEPAIEHFRAALRLDLQTNSLWGQAYSHKNLGMTYRRMAKLDLAEDHLTKSVELATSIGNTTGKVKALYSLGNVYADKGDVVGAEQAYHEALALARQTFIREIEWRSLWGLGRLAITRQNRQQAYAYFKQAIEVVERMRAAIKVEEYRNGFVANKLELYEDMVLLLLDQGKIDEAFEYSERSRARSFIDLLGNHTIRVANTNDQKLLDQQAALRTHIREAEDALARTQGQAAGKLREELKKLRSQYEELIIQIKAANPQLSSFVTVETITVKEAKGLLGPDVALVEYLITKHELIAWVLHDGKMSVARTPIKSAAALGQSVMEMRRLIQRIEDLEAYPSQLYKTLIAPIADKIVGARYLCIVPQGKLHYLPFAALYDGEDYLIDRYALFYAPSASVLKFTLKRGPTPAAKKNLRVLAIGNPDLGNPALQLPFAEKEVKCIHWNFPHIDVLTRERATERWVRKHIGDYDVIHLATHGQFDSVNPLFSCLLLAKDDQFDGRLDVNDVFGIRLKASLIVLSACQSGLGKVEKGDEVIGLNRAFMYAGTRAIVSSLWRVSDVATGIMVKHFYRNYVTMNKADSLRKAQLTVKKLYRHPAYWAAFILVGEYR